MILKLQETRILYINIRLKCAFQAKRCFIMHFQVEEKSKLRIILNSSYATWIAFLVSYLYENEMVILMRVK